jgi:membrane associated rhomboid family serine protease
VTEATADADNYCYRHPDRQSYVLCQRCGRTICPSCQTQAAVGVHCPECVREAQQSAPRRKPAVVTAFRSSSSQPVVTYSIIGLTAVVYALQFLSGQVVASLLYYEPVLTFQRPWTMITSAFVHSPTSFLHILFNMYSLFVFGPILEHLLGRGRFLALYLIAAFGGSVAVLVLDPSRGVLGASGAIFGLMGAFFVIQRRLGGNNLQIIIVIGLNLVIGFLIPNISWQAHVGGLVAGAAVAFVYLQTRRPAQRRTQLLGVAGIAAALVAVTVVRVLSF